MATKLLTAEATTAATAGAVPKLDAAGRVSTAQLGSGTANSTTFLRGDQTWATPAGGSSVTVREVDGAPTLSATAVEFDQTQGLTVANQGSGVARVSVATAAAGVKGVVPLSADGGTTAGQAVQATDSRLSNARTPTAHNHAAADINSGTMATARLGSGTANATTYLRGDQTWATPAGAGGSITIKEVDGTPSVTATVLEADQTQGLTITDQTGGVARLSIATAAAGVKGVVPLSASGGTTAGQAVQATDTRLSDARTPVAHNHAATEITTGTMATARLGSGTANSGTFLRGDQTWAAASGSSPAVSGVSLRRSTNLTLVLATDTVVDWDTEDADTDSYHAGGSPSRITFGTTGIYLITLNIEFATSTSGDRAVWIRLNGGSDIIGGISPRPVSSIPTRASASILYSATAADYIEVLARSSIGIDINAVKATCFAARRLA